MNDKLFPIQLKVEDSMLGPVLRVLNSLPGIADINLNLDDIPKKGGLLPRAVASSTHQIIIAYLASGPKSITEVRAELAKAGIHSNSTTANALNHLRKAGITESAGQGAHKLTERALKTVSRNNEPAEPLVLPPPRSRHAKDAKGAKGAKSNAKPKPKSRPAEKSEKSAKKSAKRPRDGITGYEVVLNLMRKVGSPMTRLSLADALGKAGFSPKGIDGIAHQLRQEKIIHSPKPGLYELLPAPPSQGA